MEFFQILAILLIVTILPVMIGARMVGAQNRGLGSALLAVIVLTALSLGIAKYVPNHALAFAVSTVGNAFFLAGILGTSILRGLAVSVISLVIQFGILVVFASTILALHA
jgi:hypothetical protein